MSQTVNFQKIALPEGKDECAYFLINEGEFQDFVIEISGIEWNEDRTGMVWGWNLQRVPVHVNPDWVNSKKAEIEAVATEIFKTMMELFEKEFDARHRQSHIDKPSEE